VIVDYGDEVTEFVSTRTRQVERDFSVSSELYACQSLSVFIACLHCFDANEQAQFHSNSYLKDSFVVEVKW